MTSVGSANGTSLELRQLFIAVLPPLSHHWSVRVLVVEDNSVIADAVAEGLRDQGMAVDVTYDGLSGLEKTAVNTYDVVVLDRDLPGLHGDKLCELIVASSCPSRILMLTAAGEVEDRVEGLNLGADDYLAKPFDFSELVARLRALARRSPPTPPVLVRGDLVVDRARRSVTRAGRLVPLARKELGVLEVLVEAQGAVVSAEQLLERVWDEHADPFTNTVTVTVGRLRRKLGEPPLLETVIGGGYRIP
jgi:DNA-binding response OmpR family regulator